MSRYTVFVLILVAVTSVKCGNRFRRAVDGRDISPGQQCENIGLRGVCTTSDPAERCLSLKCAEIHRGDGLTAVDFGPALQGTPCGDNKICIQGVCSEDPNPPETPVVFKDDGWDCAEYE